MKLRTDIIHLSSCLVATVDVKTDLLAAKQKGEEHLLDFITNRLFVREPDIFSKIQMLKMKTFSSMTKKVKVHSKGAEVTLKNNRNLFARMLLLAQSRNVDMKEVVFFFGSIHPIPFHQDGIAAQDTKKQTDDFN